MPQQFSPRQELAGPVVLHYLGYHLDRGGILAVLRTLEQAGRFHGILGVHPDFEQRGAPRLETLVLPALRAETMGVGTAGRALSVARRLREWLRGEANRVVHTHSRAGLLVACWLRAMGETRFLASVHAYGRRPGFYRALHRLLGTRLRWLNPAMKAYYGVGDTGSWADCLPDCVPESAVRPVRLRPRNGAAVFGCAGGIVPVKNWELVLRALSRVPPGVAVRVVHVGEEDANPAGAACADRLRALAAGTEVAGRWEWRRAQENLAPFFDEIDCLLVPSRWEASSVAALEAIAAGVPVLASAASGTRDLVRCCGGGWTFAADSAGDLAEKITRLAAGSELREWRRDDAGLARFLAPSVAESYLAAYRQVHRP